MTVEKAIMNTRIRRGLAALALSLVAASPAGGLAQSHPAAASPEGLSAQDREMLALATEFGKR